MAPTLPAELIKHIFELVYQQIKELERIGDDPDIFARDGTLIPWIFSPFLLSSKAFHALALPIAVRHLSVDRCQLGLPVLKRYNVGHEVRSLVLDDSVTEEEASELLSVCTELRTLHLGYLAAPFPPLPPTVTTLYLRSFPDLDRYAFSTLAAALPLVEKLALADISELHSHPSPIPSSWKLKDLTLRNVPMEAEAQVLAWIAESSSSLERLAIFASETNIYHQDDTTIQEEFLAASSLLDQVEDPALPRLRRLHLTDGDPLPPSSQLLDRNHLPLLEHLELTIHQPTILHLLRVSTSLRQARLTLVPPFALNRASLEIGILRMFVKHHENLELLSISIDEQLEAATPGWADDLSTLCAEMGVVFASDDSGAPEELVLYGTDEHPGFEYVEDEDSDPKFAGWLDEEGDWCECRICTLRGPDDASDATEEVSKDPKLDFDAEDDEMWAHLWSEKKRLAMGLAPNLEDRGDLNMEEPNADSASSASSSSSSNIKVDVDSIADALWVFEVDSSNPSSAPTG